MEGGDSGELAFECRSEGQKGVFQPRLVASSPVDEVARVAANLENGSLEFSSGCDCGPAAANVLPR